MGILKVQDFGIFELSPMTPYILVEREKIFFNYALLAKGQPIFSHHDTYFQLPNKKVLMRLDPKIAAELREAPNGKERLMEIIGKVCKTESKKVGIEFAFTEKPV